MIFNFPKFSYVFLIMILCFYVLILYNIFQLTILFRKA